MNPCKICGNLESNRVHEAREMMFGLRDRFHYLECAQCGCVQLLDVPTEFSKYYPCNYYSFQKQGVLKTFLRRQWSGYGFRGVNLIGWLITQYFGTHDAMLSIRRAKVPKSARILDIGCGAGNLIRDLAYLGFSQVAGVDPYLEKELAYPDGVKVFKRSLQDMGGRFDVLMLHHSFEHMDNPQEVLKHLHRLLAPEGLIIVRIPIAGSFAWKHYGVNWVHLDAPRHLFLHTTSSMNLLANGAGLALRSTIYEGNEGCLLISEQYARDIPMVDKRSYGMTRLRSIFSREEIRSFRNKARELNRTQEGDLACFYMKKA